jgi:hypothetical protein
MVKLYADEDFSLHVVALLQERGYDIETPHDHDNARKGIPATRAYAEFRVNGKT